MSVFNDLFQKSLSLGFGVLMVTREKAEELFNDLVKRGDMAPQEARNYVNQLVQKGEEQREELNQMVRKQVNRVLDEVGVVHQEQIQALQQRIQQLEQRIATLEGEDNHDTGV